MTTIEITTLDTPLGRYRLAACEGRLCAVQHEVGWPGVEARLRRAVDSMDVVAAPDPAGAATALRRYFAGDAAAFDDVEVDVDIGTPFQRRVWSALRQIPFGETRSYGEIARAIGSPSAARAVGTANAANPVGLVVPCHRVIPADGSVGGYAGGVDRKSWLLRHERRALHGEALVDPADASRVVVGNRARSGSV